MFITATFSIKIIWGKNTFIKQYTLCYRKIAIRTHVQDQNLKPCTHH